MAWNSASNQKTAPAGGGDSTPISPPMASARRLTTGQAQAHAAVAGGLAGVGLHEGFEDAVLGVHGPRPARCRRR
jgi:hypothetical protein